MTIICATGRPINFVFDSGYMGLGRRRIEWTYFRLYRIQDGGREVSVKLNGV